MDGEASGNIDKGKVETGRASLGSYVNSYPKKKKKKDYKFSKTNVYQVQPYRFN